MFVEDDIDKRIRELRETTKYTPAIIAQYVDLTIWEVKSRLRKMGLPDDRRKVCGSFEGLKAALESGMKYKDMVRGFGLDSSTIAYHAKKWGLTRRHPAPMDDNILITRYVNDLWSIGKISTDYGWCEPRVAKRLKDLGVVRSQIETKRARADRRLREMGLEHPLGAGGYPIIRRPEGVTTSRVMPNGFCFLHVLEMEKKLGRVLAKGETIHHINMDKTDYRPENLYLCDSRRDHSLIHGTLEDVCAFFYKKGVIEFDGKRYKVNQRVLAEYRKTLESRNQEEPFILDSTKLGYVD